MSHAASRWLESAYVASCPRHTHRLGTGGPSSLDRTQNKQAETHNVLQDHCRGHRLSSMNVNRAIARAVLCPVSPSDNVFFFLFHSTADGMSEDLVAMYLQTWTASQWWI